MASFIEDLDKKFRIPSKRVAYLHNVSVDTGKAANSNKFYYLYEQNDGTAKVVRGRIDHTFVEEKPISVSEWDSVIRKKTHRSKDPYTDVTHLFFEEIAASNANPTQKQSFTEIQDTVVKRLFDQLQAYANKSIQQNYTISSEKVTQKMVDEAQALIDKISGELKINVNVEVLNKELMKLFMIIPRHMGNVKNHLFKPITDKTELKAAEELLGEEQLTLDVMAGQVAMNKTQKEGDTEKETKKSLDLLETMGLECSVVTDQKELDIIHDMLNDLKRKGQQDNRKIFKRAFRVVNKKTQVRFDANLKNAINKQCQLLWHGSRNANYLSICQTGLEIRPAANGSAFGHGIYFAQHSGKSLNYSDYRGSYRSYTGGSSSQAFLLLFDVNVGSQKIVHSTGNYNLKDLRKEGHDSTWAKATSSSYIAYDEYIIYQAEQCTIKYLIEVE